MNKNIKDITNQRFGMLTVLFLTEKRSSQRDTIWHCKCDCGNEIDVLSINLKSGNTKSCGCIKKASKKDITGTRFGKLVALEETDERSNSYIVWKCRCDCGKIAFVSRGSLGSGGVKSCGCLKEEYNEKLGEKICIHDTNIACILKNVTKANKDNKTGVRGVNLRANGTYRAGITFQKKRYHLGTFKNIEDASTAYKEARENLYDNFLSWYNEQKQTG